MPVIVKRLRNLLALPVAEAPANSPAYRGSLVVEPGAYRLNGYGGAWQFVDPGLHAIHRPVAEGAFPAAGNYIVVGGDTLSLLSAAAHLTVFGSYDQGLSLADQMATARWRPLALQCGQTVDFTRALLAAHPAGQHVSRIARLLTAETPNGWNDGHVAMEAQIDGEWQVVDPACDRYWQQSLATLCDPFAVVMKERALAPAQWSHLPYPAGASLGFHTAIYSQTEPLAEFTARIFQIPGIVDPDGKTYFWMPPGTNDRAEWVLGLSSAYRILSQADWLAKFY